MNNITIALAGNPNSGKTTLFNTLTGSNQYVGNWPGVTVEKKTGEYRKDKNIKFTDLPGIYSLSPYTLEEVVSRDYLLNEKPDIIIDVVDASNIERNLYLATQLIETGIPVVIALNLMDVVRKRGLKIDTNKLGEFLNCRVVEISALRNENIDELIDVAIEVANSESKPIKFTEFSPEIESAIYELAEKVGGINNSTAKRWYAIKLFEKDSKVIEQLSLNPRQIETIEEVTSKVQRKFDDDVEGIITNERYNYVTKVVSEAVKQSDETRITDKIDSIITNRFLAIPIFVGIMYLIYKIAVDIVGGPVTDWVNDVLIGEYVQANAMSFLEGKGVEGWLVSLIGDGIIAGVGGVIGFLPVIATLFLLISLLEDVGYMARIAFILDKVFRKFGLSGKSFIPILMGTGCSVPGIMGTRTIESDKDRRMTITLASFMPCGAKTSIIAMFGAVFGENAWYAMVWYFGGIIAVMISGLILKKTTRFKGDMSPFIMELPDYRLPSASNVFKATIHSCKAFLVKAGTIILLASVVVWVLTNITTDFTFVDPENDGLDSILAFAGKKLEWLFAPLGFNWMAVVSSILGLVAKEAVVSTYSVVAGLGELSEGDPTLSQFVAQNFDVVSMLAFVFFNQFTVPCFAAIGAIREEMNDAKWTWFAIGYQMIFSYTMTLMIYQFGRVLVLNQPVNAWTVVAGIILCCYIYLMFRKDKNKSF